MTILFLIIVLVVSLICCFMSVVGEEELGKTTSNIIFVIQLILIWSLFGLYNTKDNDKPTALDVYRGNTELQITYQDTIPIDTVVVFKNK